ncbi:hypothetical protein LguiA_002742 [Lonicera macranthoides]
MKPWLRGPNNRISSNPLYEYRVIPDKYKSDDEFSEASESSSSTNSLPLSFSSNSSNGTIPWAAEHLMADQDAEAQAARAANNGVNQALILIAIEVENTVENGSNEMEFRIVESQCGVYPNLKTTVPYDYLDTSVGSG